MEGSPSHLLSLKVMRVSRPALASAWEPFYSSSPSFSARSTASILSLQGTRPLPGHPKTLRDLSHASELLTLPSSFGNIQLGETFSSCLCVNNEAGVDVNEVSLRVEMQTVTSKILLAESGGLEYTLRSSDTLESVVHHEIKELGQHVLACIVSYRLPPQARHALPPGAEGTDPYIQTFRKFYKFAVTNPLAVKTKVHVPKSPSALMSLNERDKVFLEVHIQNLTQDTLWFESMKLDCTEGWEARDANITDDDDPIFSGSSALMQPQDIRQYLYILSPSSVNLIPTVYQPGSVVPLGRLDLSWRSSYGEPGRLLTSMLSRRIPLPQPAQNPASALPPYLKRGSTANAPPRPRSPQLPSSRPASPTHSPRPSSPFRNRQTSSTPISPRPMSPPVPATVLPIPTSDLDMHLIVRDIPRSSVPVHTPFEIAFTLAVTAPTPPPERMHLRRFVTLAVQHIRPANRPQNPLLPHAASLDAVAAEPLFSPRVESPGVATPSPTQNTFNYALAHQKLLQASQIQPAAGASEGEGPKVVLLPPPISEKAHVLPHITYHGSSALVLPRTEVLPLQGGKMDFQLSFLPVYPGFAGVGPLRVVLVLDEFVSGEEDEAGTPLPAKAISQPVKEWDIVGHVWVDSMSR